MCSVPTSSTVSAAPLRQTFEDWALQTTPTHLPVGPTSGTSTYMETAFEDWVEQNQLDYNQLPVQTSTLELGAVENGTSSMENGEDDIRWETVEGDAELRVELTDSEDILDDGTTVRRQTVTKHRVCPVSDVLVINGVTMERRRGTDRLIDVTIEEDVLVLPPGVDDPDYSDDLRTLTDVQDVDESLEDGTPVHRRVTTTTIVPRDVPPLLDDQPTGSHFKHPSEDFVTQEVPPLLDDQPSGLEFEPPVEDFGHEMELKQGDMAQPPTDLTEVPDLAVGWERSDQSSGLEFEPLLQDFGHEIELKRRDMAQPLTEPAVGLERCEPVEVDQPDTETEIERCAEQVVSKSVEAAVNEVLTTSPGRFYVCMC